MIYWTGPPQLIPPIPKIYCGIKDFLIAFAGSKSEAIKLLEKCTKSSKIDTSLIYEEIRQKRNVVKWSKIVWAPSNLPIHSFNMWLCLLGRLCTKDKLGYLHIDQTCSRCLDQLEELPHLFFQCKSSSEVWLCIRKWMKINRNLISIPSALNWFQRNRMENGRSWQSPLQSSGFGKRGIEEFLKDQTLISSIKVSVFNNLFSLYPWLVEANSSGSFVNFIS